MLNVKSNKNLKKKIKKLTYIKYTYVIFSI